jgi:tetratricopeptide (TPR) repeat protein
MLAQVIFFLAVAVFLVLLIRRARLSLFSANRLVGALQRVVGGFGRLVRSLARSVTGWRLPRRSLVAPKSAPATNKGVVFPTSLQATNSHSFWKDDAGEDKAQLLTHFEEGDNLLKSGKFPEAEKFFLMAATRNPKDGRVYAKLGLVYLKMKNYADAIDALKMATKLDRYTASRHYNLALAYWGNKDSQRAIASIREAISLDPVTQKYRQFLEELLNKK